MIDALLIYPRLGNMDALVTDIPLSVIYAAADSLKRGFTVKVVDLRIHDGDWRDVLKPYFAEGVRLCGISVMTGRPLVNAREVSLFVREVAPETRVVWGGPHPTVVPETIEEPFVDYLIRGYGSEPLADLLDHLTGGREDVAGIAGLSFKQADGTPVHVPRPTTFETLSYRDIPYQLIDVNHPRYVRAYNGRRMFPIFTSIGCPYSCNFCVSPAIYREINGAKWRPLAEDDILDHIEHVVTTYGAKHIVFLDDTSFPKIERMRVLFQKIIDRGIHISIEFRGARINELDKMDDDFLNLMIRAGARVLMVGVESGSDRILKRFQKGITREQVIRVNRKLARFPQLICMYNMLYGAPGETYADLVETKDLLLRILKDNPSAYVGSGGDWKPIPGTRLTEIARTDFNYKVPRTLDEWIEIDSSDAKKKIRHPWYTDAQDNMIKVLQVATFVIDNKFIKETADNRDLAFMLLRGFARIYRPIAYFRLRFNVCVLPIEYDLVRLASWLMARLRTAPSAGSPPC